MFPSGSVFAGLRRNKHPVSTEREPGYLSLLRNGALHARVDQAWRVLKACTLCPRRCSVNRIDGETGYCRAGREVRIASWNVHRWEEPPISGTRGSGTLFFSHCTGRCHFCQNYPISQLGAGRDVTPQRLGGMMLELQEQGCHNINLVTPTHYVPHILSAIESAAAHGLHLPILYNTSGYDTVGTIRLLEGVVDIYLPDSKYADDSAAERLSGFKDYVANNRTALKEMYRQVGEQLVVDEEGIARRGLIIRHLVLPHGLSQTPDVLKWIADNLSPRMHISLMAQYFPAWHAVDHDELGEVLSVEDYEHALDALGDLGLENGWQQELD
jgi:putative pyruvate formate lyase activating enzyme